MGWTDWPGSPGAFPWVETVLLVGASAAFGAKRFQLVVSNALGLTFVVIMTLNAATLIDKGIRPSTSVRWACWFAITGVHALLVLAGAVFTGWLAGRAFRMSEGDQHRWLARIEATRRYWLFLDVMWLAIVAGFFTV